MLEQKLTECIFSFGDYNSHLFGHLTLSANGRVEGYRNEREQRWRFVNDQLQFLLGETNIVTSTLRAVQDTPLILHGSSTADWNRLHLVELFSLRSLHSMPGDPDRPPLLINSVPKAGTYWLRSAFLQLGWRPTDLHLGNNSIDDNRGLGDDPRIHRSPWVRRTEMAPGLLAASLPRGSVSVGHISDGKIIEDLTNRGVAMVQLIRDPRDVLVSLYHFKMNAVDLTQDRDPHWRQASDGRSRFLGFLACYIEPELREMARAYRCFGEQHSIPTLMYEDLRAGRIDPGLEEHLAPLLGSRTTLADLRQSVRATRGQTTSTLRTSSDQEAKEILALAQAYVKGTELGEVCEMFGYNGEALQ
jgi:hypothetical protein